MTTEQNSSLDYFQHENVRLLKDSCGRHVLIPTSNGQEGYLSVDSESGLYSQVRFLRAGDKKLQSACRSVWNSFLKVKNSEICPDVLAVSEFDGIPCCITSLPKGEPVNHFTNRNGDLPPEVAVRLVLDFVNAIRSHNPSFHKQYAICPESVWISRTKGQPRLVFGEITPIKHDNPEAHNVYLCLDLLKYLTGNPERDNRFQGLRTQLTSGPTSLEYIERSLSCYAEANPAPNYWMGFNEPASLLERIITAESAARLAAADEESVIVETARRSFWPALIAATLAVGAFMTYSIIKFSRDPDLKVVEAPRPQPARIIEQPAPVVVKKKPIVQPIKMAAAPIAKPQASIIPPAPVAELEAPVSARVENSAPVTAPAVEPKVTPMLRNLLADTGELFSDVLESPKSEWLIPAEQEKNQSKGEKAAFTLEDEKALKLLEIKKAAAAAKIANRPFQAIKHEVALLKIEPGSIESRIRLHDYLSEVQHMAISKTEITDEEIEILVEASAENAKARDILTQHYWKAR